MDKQGYIGRNISIISRQAHRYFDRVLAPYQIGFGQQFFLMRVYENQGISMYDLARPDQFDKATVTRAARRLEEQGYIYSEPDKKDKRIRRLYTTPAAIPIMDIVYKSRQRWNNAITAGMSPEEYDTAILLLEKMARNALSYTDKEDE